MHKQQKKKAADGPLVDSSTTDIGHIFSVFIELLVITHPDSRDFQLQKGVKKVWGGVDSGGCHFVIPELLGSFLGNFCRGEKM